MATRKRGTTRPRNKVTVDAGFPFSAVFDVFLDAYRRHGPARLYVPTGRTVTAENLPALKTVVTILAQEEEWSQRPWDVDAQSDMLARLTDEGVHDPYRDDQEATDANALVRMFIVVLKNLGLVRTDGSGEEQVLVATEAGAELASADDDGEDRILSSQIVKYQLPNPGTSSAYARALKGVLPHLFLLQVLDAVGGTLSRDEYRLFVNMAVSHDDLDTIVRWIDHFRQLSPDQQQELRSLARTANPNRFRQVAQNSSYQLHFYTFPPYLDYKVDEGSVAIADRSWVDSILGDFDGDLRLQSFDTKQEWQAYLGDPSQRPDWFTWLSREIKRAPSAAKAASVVRRHQARIDRLNAKQREEVNRRRTEKDIEDFFERHLDRIDPDVPLTLFKAGTVTGRQYNTDVGPIDLLCVDEFGWYVVVEIKVGEPGDSAFGQILRYMGWVEHNLEDARGFVRGVLLAGGFGEKARYSRMGFHIGRDDDPNHPQRLLKFTKHGLQTDRA